jgi:hypothetical protein
MFMHHHMSEGVEKAYQHMAIPERRYTSAQKKYAWKNRA